MGAKGARLSVVGDPQIPGEGHRSNPDRHRPRGAHGIVRILGSASADDSRQRGCRSDGRRGEAACRTVAIRRDGDSCVFRCQWKVVRKHPARRRRSSGQTKRRSKMDREPRPDTCRSALFLSGTYTKVRDRWRTDKRVELIQSFGWELIHFRAARPRRSPDRGPGQAYRPITSIPRRTG